MKNALLISISVAVVVAACHSSATTESVADKEIKTVVNRIETEGAGKTVAHLEIEGMGCVMACGSAIKKTLTGLDGVVLTEIDFESERESNFAIVEYDGEKVSSEEMVKAVNELRKGHYKVSGVVIEEYVSSPAKSESPASEESKSGGTKKSLLEPTIDTRAITFPNILDILNRLK